MNSWTDEARATIADLNVENFDIAGLLEIDASTFDIYFKSIYCPILSCKSNISSDDVWPIDLMCRHLKNHRPVCSL